jgi:hypothetical protein
VQLFPSLQGISGPVHTPDEHASSVVQTSLSLHGVASGRAGNWQPANRSQTFAVQSFPSSQGIGVPEHVPFVQVSFNVHTLPSLHGPLTGGFKQFPVPGSQLSCVHTSESSQFLGVERHCPAPLHASPVVQRLLSLQLVPLVRGGLLQPVAGRQLFAVHWFPSSQGFAMPPQIPFVHTSFKVQKLLSVHAVPETG